MKDEGEGIIFVVGFNNLVAGLNTFIDILF